jgi:hypothetical protein
MRVADELPRFGRRASARQLKRLRTAVGARGELPREMFSRRVICKPLHSRRGVVTAVVRLATPSLAVAVLHAEH